ncbi:MAG: glutaredoxin 3 [Woeseiaceae bacterium]|nr:glutaredoxin 3 [Woeseiaceae bacterium]
MTNVTIYTKNYCPYCTRAKALLDRKGIAYDEIDVTYDEALQSEMKERSQRRTVPQIFVGEQHIGGSDDLVALDQSGEFDRLFGASVAA